MSEPHLALSTDGKILYQLLSKEYLTGAMKTLKNSFFLNENVCKAVGLSKNPAAITELEGLVWRAVKDGVSVIAVDTTTEEVAGVAVNKLRTEDCSEEIEYFESFIKSCKQPQTKAILEFIVEADNLQNLFELSQADCLLDIMFLTTSAEFRGKGIGKKLCEISIEIAQKLMSGKNVKQSIDDTNLGLEPVPKAVSAIFSSFITQRIGRQLDFVIAAEKDFKDFQYEGHTFSDVIGNHTRTVTLEYKKLL